MICCKSCRSEKTVKNGIVRKVQRYRCKGCGLSFVLGDRRIKESVVVKKALSVILYALGKASYGTLAQLFGCSRSLICRWIAKEAKKLSLPEIDSEIKEIEFDEMWHFIQAKKTRNGSLKPWIVAAGEPLPGLSVVVMLQRFSDCTTR